MIRDEWPIIAIGIALMAFWTYHALKWIRDRVAYRRRAERALMEGRCRGCGYDLRASPQRCPECGLEVEAGTQPRSHEGKTG